MTTPLAEGRLKTGLVLSGGGARGAYQAGVLGGMAEIMGERFGAQPFPIITGVSAGSINASFLASGQTTFAEQAELLLKLWSELRSDRVIKTDPLTLGKLGFGWFKDLSTGGAFGQPASTYLLNSTPLHAFLKERIDFDQIRRNIDSKILDGVSVTTTSYGSGTSVTFFDSRDITSWTRSARIGVRATLTIDHVLASSSIPVFFKPVRIGNNFFGDGGIRSASPMSPAIHLGADRLIAIGVRYPRNELEAMEINQQVTMDTISLAEISGVLLNSLFLDALEFDYERLMRVNETVSLLTAQSQEKSNYRLRKIPTLLFLPSVDLGQIAADQFNKFPVVLRYFLRGLGASESTGADLLSYLAFDQSYTQSLVTVGKKDALDRRDEILAFFEAGMGSDSQRTRRKNR
ncbi:MAG: patatin-like phospholipase family protein [Chitinophagaceae bacterium]|nr:patatin-like phospholipase family protein [Oligoflexus sp.]